MKTLFYLLFFLVLFSFNITNKPENEKIEFINCIKTIPYGDSITIKNTDPATYYVYIDDKKVEARIIKRDNHTIYKFKSLTPGEKIIELKDLKGQPYFSDKILITIPVCSILMHQPLKINTPYTFNLIFTPKLDDSNYTISVNNDNKLSKKGWIYTIIPKSEDVVITVKLNNTSVVLSKFNLKAH